MIRRICLLSFLLALFSVTNAQSTLAFADSIRKAYHIPEIAYAVVSSTGIYEMQTIGIKKINTTRVAEATDKFRIGSNTKAITGFIAALLVKQNKITWDTKFFDLYPELKAKSKKVYYNVTLLNLLSFRTKLFPYTYTYAEPTKKQFTGNEDEQRYQFTKWFFQQEPVAGEDSIHFSNLGYVAAALMLEKVSGKIYKQLVADLGTQLNIHFDFGAPNATNSLQPWGHDKDLKPEAPADNYKLNWLLAAGNITLSLPDYVKFIQLQLQGLAGQSKLLSKEEFEFLHYGLYKFAVGWFWLKNEDGQSYSYNIGNPGTFLSKVYVFKDIDKAYILLSNAQSPDTDKGLSTLFNELERKYSQ
jgi:CubicO group peptidase (beta-lactamase class C family)